MTRQEQLPSRLRPEHDPIIVAVGGTGAKQKVVDDYYRHLVEVSAADISATDKLFPLENGGLQPLQETYDDLNERIYRFRLRHIGRKVIVLGHSQGGVHAAQLGVDSMADAVVTLAAPIRGGVTEGLPTMGDSDIARMLEKELKPESVFMATLIRRIESEWPNNVPLHVISAGLGDVIVPQTSQYGLNLPGTHSPREFVVAQPVPLWFGGDVAARRLVGAPGHVEIIAHTHAVGHFMIPRAEGLPGHLRLLANELHPDTTHQRAA